MSLLTICQNALNEITGFEVPSTYVGNENLTAKSCVALVQRAGKLLERRYQWVELIKEHTFTTVSGTDAYALPSDFRRFANMSQWDRTNFDPMFGPVTPAEWQFLKSSVAGDVGTITKWFRIKGSGSNQFFIHPTPATTGETIAFDYFSTGWINDVSVADTFVSEFTADNDTALIDEELLTLDLKWRFLKAKGFAYQDENQEWAQMRDKILAANGGARKISMDMQIIAEYSDNIPETGFGGV